MPGKKNHTRENWEVDGVKVEKLKVAKLFHFISKSYNSKKKFEARNQESVKVSLDSFANAVIIKQKVQVLCFVCLS